MLLALLRVDLNMRQRPRRWLPSSMALFVTGAAIWALAGAPFVSPQPVAAAASFLLLAAVVLPSRGGGALRALDLRPLVILGVASYSLYLWHDPIVISIGDHLALGPVAVVLVSVVLCVGIALASYALVERPFLRLRRRWGPTAASGPPEDESPGSGSRELPAEGAGPVDTWPRTQSP
jgi:peptidoglycan/LPS O-acetylase OafA/YrhL